MPVDERVVVQYTPGRPARRHVGDQQRRGNASDGSADLHDASTEHHHDNAGCHHDKHLDDDEHDDDNEHDHDENDAGCNHDDAAR